jgi:uncharacterized protein (TIGR02466 family)
MKHVMTHLNLFPTVIGGFVDKDLVKRLLPIAEKIIAVPENNTNTWGYKTTYSKDHMLLSELGFFSNYTKEIGKKYLGSLGYKQINLYSEVFFSEMFEGDFHAAHEHPNTTLSGIVYLRVPEGSSKIRFHDPRFHNKVVNLPVIESNQANWQWYDIAPEEGLVLIWPGWLNHEVLKNQSKEGRLTAVFNLTTLSPEI